MNEFEQKQDRKTGAFPRFFDAGETALVVEFGDEIDEAANDRVLNLDQALSAAPTSGMLELVPTYRSLMVHYDPLILSRTDLIQHVRRSLPRGGKRDGQGRLWTMPACYDEEFSEDLDFVARQTGLPKKRVIEIHGKARYRVYMCGFAPGFAYLGGLPEALALPRRASPRRRIPAGSLIIAGGQALVTSIEMPSGWHVLGQTPEMLFAIDRDPPFLLKAGDVVTFDVISREQFETLAAQVRSGVIVSNMKRLP